MKIVIGIILVVIVIAALVLYLVLLMNSHNLAFCGDIRQSDGSKLAVTRIYTADFNANQTLSEIVNRMNDNEEGNISADELTEILATYQNIIYAPVFLFNLTQEDTNTYVLEGSVYNGMNPEGQPETTDFTYRNLSLSAGVPNGKILAAQNVYRDGYDDNGTPVFTERKKVIDPVVVGADQAAIAFRDFDSYRIVFTTVEDIPASITLAFTYEVVAQNPLDFTNIRDGAIGVTITADTDERGNFAPTIEMERIFAIPTEE